MSDQQVQWVRSEWHDHPEAVSGWFNGIMADVTPDQFEESKWIWTVKPSSSRCEFPELYDANVVATVEEGKAKAEEAMKRADVSYQHIKYD